MTQQRLLFEHPQTKQMNRIWQQLEPKNKRQIITLLAQMGQATVTKSLKAETEADDDS